MPDRYIRTPAPPYIRCPKCGEMNADRKHNVWFVSDERGVHAECDVCSESFSANAVEIDESLLRKAIE